MTQGSLDLAGEQVSVVAEVALQRVAVDDDPVLIAFASQTVSEVVTVRMRLGTEIGDHHRDVRQNLLEFVGQPVDRIDDQRFELVELGSVGHVSNSRGRGASSVEWAISSECRAAQGRRLLVDVTRDCWMADPGRYPDEMATLPDLDSLPGARLVQSGVTDLEAGRESAEALLVSIGAPRLRSVGIELSSPIASPEHKLYLLLMQTKGDAAHSAYNALIRRLVSFERAAACAN